MRRERPLLKRLLYPPLYVLLPLCAVAYGLLGAVFALSKMQSLPAYGIYALSAYALVLLGLRVPQAVKGIRSGLRAALKKRPAAAAFVRQYRTDRMFRSSFSLWRGLLLDVLYTLFRLCTGIAYASVWFITLAVYHLFLGVLRVYLAVCLRRERRAPAGLYAAYRCYARAAGWLLLLNIPMGGMVFLILFTDSGFVYPGYVIYLSAAYTFYAIIAAAVHLVGERRTGSPLLRAANALRFCAAMMSVLGLQTAMLTAFSTEGAAFRLCINAATGVAVLVCVLALSVYMQIKAGKQIHKLKQEEPT